MRAPFWAVLCFAAMGAWPAAAQVEQPSVTLAVSAKALPIYLAIDIAVRQKLFEAEGLKVTVADFRGGSQTLQSVVGGSADFGAASYDHTLRMQLKGQDIRALFEFNRGAYLLGVRTDLADKVKSPADLKGMPIGVSAPGSATQVFATYLLAKGGVAAKDVSFVGVGLGAGAVAAVVRGTVSAVSMLDPAAALLERQSAIVVLADGRTADGAARIFGGPVPQGALYAKHDFVEQNPKTAQALVNAIYKAQRWVLAASEDDIIAALPTEYTASDVDLYRQMIRTAKQSLSPDGAPSPEGLKAMLEMNRFDPELADAKVNVDITFDGRFVEAARAKAGR